MDIRNLLVVISLTLSMLIGLVLHRGTAGQNAPVRTDHPLIGLSLDTLKEARWQADRDLFVAECQARGATVSVNEANSDDSQQARDVRSLLAAHVQALVIVPHDGLAMAASVEAAQRAGIPVIAYDRLVQNCDLDLYTSFDNVRVGRQQAQFIVDHLPTPGHGAIVRIYGAPTDNNARLFKQGQDEVLKPYLDRHDITVVHEDWAEDWRPDNAVRIVHAALSKGVKFDAVLASNDGTAGGAVQALGALAGKTLVTGQDAEVAACQRIAAGTQSMSVYKPLKVLALKTADAAVALAKGKPVIATATVNNGAKDVPAILNDTIVVTKDNLLDAIVKSGFHAYEEVYAGLPADERPPKP